MYFSASADGSWCRIRAGNISPLWCQRARQAECSRALTWLPVAEPCGDRWCCRLRLPTNAWSRTCTHSHTCSTGCPCIKSRHGVQCTHASWHLATSLAAGAIHLDQSVSEVTEVALKLWESSKSHARVCKRELRVCTHANIVLMSTRANAQITCQRILNTSGCRTSYRCWPLFAISLPYSLFFP